MWIIHSLLNLGAAFLIVQNILARKQNAQYKIVWIYLKLV